MRKKIFFIFFIFIFSLFTVNYIDAAKTKSKKSTKILKAKVKLVKGKAFVKKGKVWKKLKINMILTAKDVIKVSKKSTVNLKTSNGKLLIVKGSKVVKLQTLFVQSGKKKSMNALINKLGKGKRMNSYAPTAVAGVRGADVSKQKKKVKKEELNWEDK